MYFVFDPGLVLHLPLHELNGSSFTSKDAYGRQCTVTGPLWTAQGRQFDGVDDKLAVSSDASMRFTDRLSFGGWFYIDPSDPKLDGQLGYLFDSGGYADGNGFVAYWDDRGGAGKINHLTFTITGTSTYGVAGADNAVTTAGWYYLFGTYDKDEAGSIQQRLYVNDNVIATANLTEVLKTQTGNLTIGAKANGTAFLKMTCGEFTLNNRALTALEGHHNRMVTKWRYQ